MELTHVILPGAFALDMMVTSCPACFKLPTKALPMKPVPPPGKKNTKNNDHVIMNDVLDFINMGYGAQSKVPVTKTPNDFLSLGPN